MKKELKIGAILGYVNMIASLVISFVYTPFLLKSLGQSEHGLYALIASVIGYLSVLDMGFGNAMVRFVSKSKASPDKLNEDKINGMFLFLYLIIGMTAFIIGWILIGNVSVIFKALTPEELSKARIMMIILVCTVSLSFPLSIFDSYVLSNEKFKYIKILSLIKTIIVPLTMLPLLLLGHKAITMVLVTSAYSILFHLITIYYCFKKLKMKICFEPRNMDKVLLREVLVYSFFIFLNLIVDSIYNNTDQVILGSVSGTIAVSIYAVAARVSSINTSFSTTISGLFFPRITKTLEEEDGSKKVSDIFIKVSRIQLYIMALIMFGFIVFGKQFILLWVGNNYISAYYIILLLMVPAIIPLTQNIGISIIQAKNKHKFRSIVYACIAVLNIAISIPLAKAYGGIGAAIGTAVANIIGQITIMNIYYWKKVDIDIPTYWKRFITFMLPWGLFSAGVYFVASKITFRFITLIIAIIIYTLIYLVYAYLFMNKEEKTYVKKIKNRLLRRR